MSDLIIDEVMTALPHSIRSNETLQAAHDMMKEHQIRHLPVQEGGKLVGVVSERDLYFASSLDELPLDKIKVSTVYSDEPYSVEQGTPLKEVVAHLGENYIGCALVMDQGMLVGIFTTTDACRVLASKL